MNTHSDSVPKVKELNISAPTFTPGEEWDHVPDSQLNSPSNVICNAALTCPMDQNAFFQAEALER